MQLWVHLGPQLRAALSNPTRPAQHSTSKQRIGNASIINHSSMYQCKQRPHALLPPQDGYTFQGDYCAPCRARSAWADWPLSQRAPVAACIAAFALLCTAIFLCASPPPTAALSPEAVV